MTYYEMVRDYKVINNEIHCDNTGHKFKVKEDENIYCCKKPNLLHYLYNQDSMFLCLQMYIKNMSLCHTNQLNYTSVFLDTDLYIPLSSHHVLGIHLNDNKCYVFFVYSFLNHKFDIVLLKT